MYEEREELDRLANERELNFATIVASIVVSLAMTALNTMSAFNNAEKFFERRHTSAKKEYKQEVARVDSIKKSFSTANTSALANWESKAMTSRESKLRIASAESYVKLAKFDTTKSRKLLIAEAEANLGRVRAEIFQDYERSNPRPSPKVFVSESAPVEASETPFAQILAISLFLGIVLVAIEYLLGKDFLSSTLHTFLSSCYGLFVTFLHVQALRNFFELPLFISVVFSVAMLATAFSVYTQTTSRARGGVAHILLEHAKVFWFKMMNLAAENYNKAMREAIKRDVDDEAKFLTNLGAVVRKHSGQEDFVSTVRTLIKSRITRARENAIPYKPLAIGGRSLQVEAEPEPLDEIVPPSLQGKNGVVSIGYLEARNERPQKEAEPPKEKQKPKTKPPNQTDFFAEINREQQARSSAPEEGEGYVRSDEETAATDSENPDDNLSSLVVTGSGVKRTCALHECGIDISHMRTNKMYCCEAHKSKHHRKKSPE